METTRNRFLSKLGAATLAAMIGLAAVPPGKSHAFSLGSFIDTGKLLNKKGTAGLVKKMVGNTVKKQLKKGAKRYFGSKLRGPLGRFSIPPQARSVSR